jgi:hypothetical protein
MMGRQLKRPCFCPKLSCDVHLSYYTPPTSCNCLYPPSLLYLAMPLIPEHCYLLFSQPDHKAPSFCPTLSPSCSSFKTQNYPKENHTEHTFKACNSLFASSKSAFTFPSSCSLLCSLNASLVLRCAYSRKL